MGFFVEEERSFLGVKERVVLLAFWFGKERGRGFVFGQKERALASFSFFGSL